MAKAKKKCAQCEKVTANWTLRRGKAFCSTACVKKYGAKHGGKKSNVCDFC